MVQKLVEKDAGITLGYWGIRGLAQPIRFLLAAADVPFSEVRLGISQSGALLNENDEDEDWEKVRLTLDMPFPNLPFLIDCSVQPPVNLSQSNAILRYLARRFDYYGDSNSDRIKIDVIQDEAYDFRNEIIATAYTLGDGYGAVFDHFSRNTLPRYLDSFETYLASRNEKNYFVGSRLSLVDFVLYELFWQMIIMVPNSITGSKRPALLAFIKAFEEEPRIAKYMQSENYIERPINMAWASFA